MFTVNCLPIKPIKPVLTFCKYSSKSYIRQFSLLQLWVEWMKIAWFPHYYSRYYWGNPFHWVFVFCRWRAFHTSRKPWWAMGAGSDRAQKTQTSCLYLDKELRPMPGGTSIPFKASGLHVTVYVEHNGSAHTQCTVVFLCNDKLATGSPCLPLNRGKTHTSPIKCHNQYFEVCSQEIAILTV